MPIQDSHAKEFSLFREIDSMIKNDHQSSFRVKLIKFVVKRGDNLSGLLSQLGIHPQDIHSAMQSLRAFYNPKKLKIGQEISAVVHSFPNIIDKRLQSLSVKTSPDKEISVERRLQDDFMVVEKVIDFDTKWGMAEGKIQSSLYETIQKMGIPHESTKEIFQAFNYDIDFERDLHQGDKVKLVFERFYHLNGEFSHYGKILFASLELNDRTLEIYRHVLPSGDAEYFSADGTSVKKSLMKTPIPSASVSSSFGMRRHPILSYTRLHKGVDFRASRGTPIMAAGDGVVTYKGFRGGYGNYLMIRHNSNQTTAYAHIDHFASGLRKGKRVKQGEIVAYVGSTGRATGAHLHYEVLIGGVRVNPLTIKAIPGSRLRGQELRTFLGQKELVSNFMTSGKSPSVASITKKSSNS